MQVYTKARWGLRGNVSTQVYVQRVVKIKVIVIILARVATQRSSIHNEQIFGTLGLVTFWNYDFKHV